MDSVTGAVVFLGERVRCPSFATAATHELLHALGAVFGTSTLPPHACHDGAHVCDRDDDVLARGQVGPETLAAAVLDAGRDDYYGTTGRSYDVRSSPYLRHLDTP